MYQLNKEQFGQFVSQLRREKGYTQKQLADQLMISDKAVSKWETGTTIPDTGMLIPLAEALEVTVTELLTGHRIEQQAMEPEQVEEIVKTAIVSCGEQTVPRAWQKKSRWHWAFPIACLCAAFCLLLLFRMGGLSPSVQVNAILTPLFGGYFCFFVRLKLPSYYDEHKISGMVDGIFRMNIPGLYFNNRNWPHIVEVGRWSMVGNMVLFPVVSLMMSSFLPELWNTVELGVFLTMLLGGLFVPVYLVGRKYGKE